MGLKDLAKKLNSEGGIPFMEGREKAEIPTGSSVTVNNYGFIKGDDGDYVVLSLMEFPKNFFFGGGVVTEKFQALDNQLTESDMQELKSEGLPVLFAKKTNKAGKRTYTTCEFYPVD